jgi:tetratricopeptide (TPR) repeat protein
LQNDPAYALSARILQSAAASPRRAEKEVKLALKTHPKSAHLHFAAGLIALQQKKPKDARNSFIRAINTGNAPAATHLNAALVEADIGQFPRALEMLDRASTRFPDDRQFETTAIKLCLQTQELDLAQARIKAASEAGLTEELHFLAGRVYEAQGNLPQAIVAYEQAGETPLAKAALSQCYAFTNQEAAALKAAKAGLALAPQDPAQRFNLAWRQLESGAFDEAAQGFHALLTAQEQRFEAFSALASLPTVKGADAATLENTAKTLEKAARSPTEKGHVAMAQAHLAEKRGDTAAFLAALGAANAFYAKDRLYDHAADAKAQA